jgi:hypothetical protein
LTSTHHDRANPEKAPDAWIVLVEMADEATWWVIWRQPEPDAVDILWIGPQPGPDAFAYSTETP